MPYAAAFTFLRQIVTAAHAFRLQVHKRFQRLADHGFPLSRTDGDTVQGRSGDATQRDAATASGAQILSTDYPFNEKASWSGYSVNFPNGEIARCNPLFNLPNCGTLR